MKCIVKLFLPALLIAFCCLTLGCAATGQKDLAGLTDGLAGYWKLAEDGRDYSGHDRHAVNHGVVFKDGAAEFSGHQAYLEVPDSEAFQFGTGDMAISIWVQCRKPMTDVTGDILGQFDPARRRGINFNITGSSPAYCSVSDIRHVYFGIDNQQDGPWIDHGRPSPTNTLINAMIVYRGELYVGISDATDPKQACRVFRFAGGQKWIDCGRVSEDPNTHSVMSMIVHDGRLYAGTGTYDWTVANKGECGPSRVYRYEGGTTWTDCGAPGIAYRATSLASLNGDLILADDRMNVARYDGDQRWTLLRESKEKIERIDSMMILHGRLYGSRTYPWLYEGDRNWRRIGDLIESHQISQIHSMIIHEGSLILGGWVSGVMLRYKGPDDWEYLGQVGIDPKFAINEINDFTVYNGKLYAGVLPKSELWRYEGGTRWSLVRQMVNHPRWEVGDRDTWGRITSMAIYQGRLFLAPSTCRGVANADDKTEAGHVYSWQAGRCVSYDDDLGGQWRHLTAVRAGSRLHLYVDGQKVASSEAFNPADYDLSTGQPLRIGFGAENYFNGRMRELRVYKRALSDEEIRRLADLR